MNLTAVAVICSLFLIVVIKCENATWRNENELFDVLTDSRRYDRRSRPRNSINNNRSSSFNEASDPVRLNASLYVSVLGGLDAQSTEFTSQLTIRYEWEDQRLSYADMAPDVTELEAEDWAIQRIWIPTIYITNEKQSSKIGVPKDNVLISITPQGRVSYQYRVNLRIYCAMDVRKFPFDQQICRLHLESWGLRSKDLILDWDSNGSESAIEINPEYRMLEYRLKNVDTASSETQRSTGNFSRLDVAFTLQREAGHYVIDYYIPAILLVLLSWVAFWLDPSAIPGRVTLGSSTLLTLITLSRNVSSTIPKVSYIKALDLYSILCITFIFCSLLEFAFVNSIWRRRRNIPIKKLDTRHVLKSTLTPNASRRPSFTRLNEANKIMSSSRFTFNTLPNELTVTSCDGLGNELRRRLSNCQLSASLGNLNNTNNDWSQPTVSTEPISPPSDASCLSLSIPVPVTSPGADDSVQRPPNPNQADNQGNKKSMDPHEIAKWLDRRSRVAFPAMFLFVNILYWSFIWI